MDAEEFRAGQVHKLADGGVRGQLQRVYEGHGPGEVWSMLTRADLLPKWLAPGSIELREGGAVKIEFADSGTTIDSTVLELVPQRVLAYSWSRKGEPQRLLRWEVVASGSATTLTLVVDIPPGEDAAKAYAGFEGHLEMLGAALEGVPMKFPFDLFLRARSEYARQLAAA